MVFSSWPTENSSILHKREAALLMGDAEQYANNHLVYEHFCVKYVVPM